MRVQSGEWALIALMAMEYGPFIIKKWLKFQELRAVGHLLFSLFTWIGLVEEDFHRLHKSSCRA